MLRTSFATKSLNNLLPSIDVAAVDKVNIGDSGDYKDKTVIRSLSKNLNGAKGYLIRNARRPFTQLR